MLRELINYKDPFAFENELDKFCVDKYVEDKIV